MKKFLGNIKGENGRGIKSISSEQNLLKIKYSDDTEQSINIDIESSNLSTTFKIEKIFEGSSSSISVNTKDYVFFILDSRNEILTIPSVINEEVHAYYTQVKVEKDKLVLNTSKERKLYGFKTLVKNNETNADVGSASSSSNVTNPTQEIGDVLFNGNSTKLTLTKAFTLFNSIDVTYLDTNNDSTFTINYKITETSSDFYLYDYVKQGHDAHIYAHHSKEVQIYRNTASRFSIKKILGLGRR